MSAAVQSPLQSHATQSTSPNPLSATLPVPQIQQAHALFLDPPDAGPAATVVAPPYPEMASGDTVTFSFVPPAGKPPTHLAVTLNPTDVGKAVVWAFDSNDLWNAYQDQVETFYTVEHVDGTQSVSAVQSITIDTPPTGRLTPPSIAGHDDGGLDPGQFPDGVLVEIPLYQGAAVGDGVLLYWQGAQAAKSTVQWRQLEAGDVARGALQVLIDPEWLTANIGGQVVLTYQYAREGAAESSEPTTLEILVPLKLGPPIVEKAEAEGDGSESKGFLLAKDALTGVYVRVPASDSADGAVGLEVHWDGHANGGQHVAAAPHDEGDPLRFKVPSSAVAANIGGESKRFGVFYRLTLENGRTHTSEAFNLRIKALPSSNYPSAQCRQSQGKPGLSMADVPAEGAELYVSGWPLAAEGQALTIWVKGVSVEGAGAEHVARAALPATQDELDARAVAGRLPAAFLQELKVDSDFALHAKVSYDGGESTVTFPSSSIQWLG